jgi:hypothetical protein
MKLGTSIVLFAIMSNVSVQAQQSSFQDSLLDQLTGKWILRGSIAGQETTHDVAAEWVLAHNYLQLHEVSREKNGRGDAVYEAIVYIGWDEPTKQYQCLWLDVTGGGGLSAQAIGHGMREGDSVAFIFKGADGSLFHTTFVHEKGTWRWIMDGEENGKLQPFARLKLTRE